MNVDLAPLIAAVVAAAGAVVAFVREELALAIGIAAVAILSFAAAIENL